MRKQGMSVLLQHLKKWAAEQQGSSLVLVAFMMVGLLVMAGLVIDGGSLYAAKSHLQKAANAAVLSGAQELTQEESSVRSVVDEVVHAHGEEGHMTGLTVQMEDEVRIELRKEVPLGFAGLLGIDKAPVEVVAAAEILTMGEAVGAAPLGIDDSIPLEFYKEYKLKVDQTEVSTGNFGVLALGGTGSATYEDNLKNGYLSGLTVGQVVETQTGNISGKTRSGVQERIDSCPYPEGDTSHRDCPRIILVPVYKPHNYFSGQLKEVEITGFAYFYISKPMDMHDTSITGMFIKRAGTGFVKPSAVNKGAYAIRLTE